MVNSIAITQFESFYAISAQAFDNNQEAFENNVRRYLQLKEMLHNRDVSLDADFQRLYSYFYGLNRALSVQQKAAYFSRLERMKDTDYQINVRALTEELRPSLGKYHFSFCSKMANIVDDELYPIYDRNVRRVFHRANLGHGLDYWENIYQDITDTYQCLMNHPVIKCFENRFNSHGMGYMKVLDALFWVIGR